MTNKKKLTLLNWGTAVILMLLFMIWHGVFEGPLSPAELEHYLT